MASAGAKATRRADALQRLSRTLGHKPVDLHATARGDAEMALIMTLERVADKVDEANKAANKRIAALEEQVAALEEQVAALTANTAQEPSTPADAVGPVTVETVEIVQDGSKTVMDETAKPKGKGGKNDA